MQTEFVSKLLAGTGPLLQNSPGSVVENVVGLSSFDFIGLTNSPNSVIRDIDAQSRGAFGTGAVRISNSANTVVQRLTARASTFGVLVSGLGTVTVDDSVFVGNTDGVRVDASASLSTVRVMRSQFRANTVDVNTERRGQGFDSALLVGNDHGDPGDRTTTAFELATPPVGTRRAVSRAVGIRALIDNLYTGQTPTAVITSPLRGTPIHPEFCLPLEAGLSEDVDVVDCTWTADGQPLILGADGCADHNLTNGTHTIALTCDGGATCHSTTILVDDQRMGGVVRGDQTISGAHIVDTDIIVPAGRSLTLAAGTALTFTLNSDRAFNTPVLRTVRGDPAKVEIAVEGTLHVDGTVQAPVLLSGDVGSAQKSWTGILAGDAATVVLDNAQFRGATFAVSSDAPGTDQIAHADITVRNGLFQGTGTNNDLATQIAFQGACPSVVDGMVVRDINQFMNCLSGVDVDVSGLDVRSASQPQGGVRLFQIGDVRSTAVIALQLRDSTLVSTLGGQVIYSNRGSGLANVSLANLDTTLFVFNRGFTMPKTFNMADSVVRQMFTFFELPTNQVLVERTRFEGGTGLVVGPRESFIVRDCLFNDVDNILDDVRTSSLNVLQVRGSRFLGVAQFLGANDDGTRPTLGYDFTGNDFSGVARIINQANTSSPITFNLGSSFFGTTDKVAIEAVIQDTRTDVSATDTIMGKSDYTGFLSSAPTLNVPE